MKLDFNFIKKSKLFNQYSEQIIFIFNNYQKGAYKIAGQKARVILKAILDNLFKVEGLKNKPKNLSAEINFFKAKKIYAPAIINGMEIVDHVGQNGALSGSTVTRADFLMCLQSLRDLLAYWTNIYENSQVEYWDGQLTFQSKNAQKEFFKKRQLRVKLPKIDLKKQGAIPDLVFDSEIAKDLPEADDPKLTVKQVKPKVKNHAVKAVKPPVPVKPKEKNVPRKKPVATNHAPKKKLKRVLQRSRRPQRKKKSQRLPTVIGLVAALVILGVAMGGLNQAKPHHLNSAARSAKVVKSKKRSLSLSIKAKEKAKSRKKTSVSKSRKQSKATPVKKTTAKTWLTGKVYQLNIITQNTIGTVNHSGQQDLPLPSPQTGNVFIAFGLNKAVLTSSASQAKAATKNTSALKKIAKQKSAMSYRLKDNRLSLVLNNLPWRYLLNQGNQIHLSKSGRAKVQKNFNRALNGITLKPNTDKSYSIKRHFGGKDFANTTGDNYQADYKFSIRFRLLR